MQQPQAAGVGPAHRDQVPPPGPFSPPLPTPGTPPGLRTDRPSAPPPAVSLVCPTGPVSPPGGHPGASGDGLGWGALLASRAAEHPGRPAAGAARALELRARAEGTSAGVYPCHCWPVTRGVCQPGAVLASHKGGPFSPHRPLQQDLYAAPFGRRGL